MMFSCIGIGEDRCGVGLCSLKRKLPAPQEDVATLATLTAAACVLQAHPLS